MNIIKNKNITIVGPRSVGKSSVSKFLSTKLNYKYMETDSIMNKKMEKYGGLDKVIKSKKIEIIMRNGPKLVKDALKNKKIVLDLAGGAISSRKGIKMGVCQKIIKEIKSKSFVVGLLPFKNEKESIKFLFKREKERKHFLDMNKDELFIKVEEDYIKVEKALKRVSDVIIYVQKKSIEDIALEIIEKIER